MSEAQSVVVTAVIKNARFFDIGQKQVVMGQIYDDARGRFPDGHQINTSEVLDVKGDIVTTKNSTYRIERRAA
ncbi:hypothetical protein [Agrobacterium sp. CG674]